jgi:hypothetical protein
MLYRYSLPYVFPLQLPAPAPKYSLAVFGASVRQPVRWSLDRGVGGKPLVVESSGTSSPQPITGTE